MKVLVSLSAFALLMRADVSCRHTHTRTSVSVRATVLAPVLLECCTRASVCLPRGAAAAAAASDHGDGESEMRERDQVIRGEIRAAGAAAGEGEEERKDAAAVQQQQQQQPLQLPSAA